MNTKAGRSRRFTAAKGRTIVIVMLLGWFLNGFAAAAEQGTAAQLPQLLEQQGWRHESDAQGNVYYHPPRSGATDDAQEAIVSDLNQADIPRLLLERGWRIETNARGDMLLRPVSPPAPPDIDQLLRERGWRMLSDVHGNTLLMPLAPAAAASAEPAAPPRPQAAPAPAPGAASPTEEPRAQFRQALEDKGWTVRAEPDGSLTVFPPAFAPQAPRPDAARAATGHGYCAGITLAGEEAERPIDSEEKARRLGTAWIAQFGQADYEVGKARQINQVFVVSIVESTPPHSLRNQLVVREDASIVALY
jgi:hypothetical protein